MRLFKIAIALGLVAGALSCKPKMNESVVKSVSDGTYRFGKMTSASVTSMSLVEFKLCHTASDTCLNPFINSAVKPSVRASFLGQKYDAFDQRRQIASIMQSRAADVQSKERDITRQNDVLTSSRYKLSIATNLNNSASQEVLTATNGLNSLRQQASASFESNTATIQRLEGNLGQLSQRLTEARNVASNKIAPEPKLDESAMSITTTGSSKPTSVPGDPSRCQCGATPTRFFLQGHISTFGNAAGSTRFAVDPLSSGMTCDTFAQDPPECRWHVEFDEVKKEKFYSPTDCLCLYGIAEDKSNRKFKNKGKKCSQYEVDPEECVNPEELAAHRQRIAAFEAAHAAWAKDKEVVDRAAAQLKELNEVTIPQATQALAKARAAASSQQAADMKAQADAQEVLRQAQAKAQTVLTSLNSAKEATASEDARLQTLNDNLVEARAKSKITKERLVAEFTDSETGYNGKLVLASSEGRASYVDDWNKPEATAQLDSVSDVILAIAQLYNFQLSCRLWSEPFSKIGGDISRFAPKAVRQCEGDVEGDWALAELEQSGMINSTAKLVSGVYRHPDMDPVSVRNIKTGGFTLSTLGTNKTSVTFASCELGKCISEDQTIVVMSNMRFGFANPKTKEIYYFATSAKDLIKEEPDPVKADEKAVTTGTGAVKEETNKSPAEADTCKCADAGTPTAISHCAIFKGGVSAAGKACNGEKNGCCTEEICEVLVGPYGTVGKIVWNRELLSLCGGKFEMERK
jgi:hypothetical protein